MSNEIFTDFADFRLLTNEIYGKNKLDTLSIVDIQKFQLDTLSIVDIQKFHLQCLYLSVNLTFASRQKWKTNTFFQFYF